MVYFSPYDCKAFHGWIWCFKVHAYLHHLLGNELPVVAVLDLDKLFMRALLNDFALLEHDDVVCVADGRKPAPRVILYESKPESFGQLLYSSAIRNVNSQ